MEGLGFDPDDAMDAERIRASACRGGRTVMAHLRFSTDWLTVQITKGFIQRGTPEL